MRPPGGGRVRTKVNRTACSRYEVKGMAREDATIAVKVRFMGDLRALFREREVIVHLPKGSTVKDLMESLSNSYGEPFTCRVFSGPGTLHHYMLLFLNGQNIAEAGGMAARLGDSEVELVMLPMFEGG